MLTFSIFHKIVSHVILHKITNWKNMSLLIEWFFSIIEIREDTCNNKNGFLSSTTTYKITFSEPSTTNITRTI